MKPALGMTAATAPLLLMLAAGSARGDDTVGRRDTAWDRPEFTAHRDDAMRFGDDYRKFIARHKTEREVVGAGVELARRAGFRLLVDATRRAAVRPGAKLYSVTHDKLAAFAVVGKRPLTEGVHLIVAHVDAVRLDLKQRPLYDDANLALLETHYYGRIKRYQWLGEPLELRGVVVTRGGKSIRVAIGDDPDEPVLVVPDLAAQLSAEVDAVEGEQVPAEQLDPIVASASADQAARLLEQQLGISIADLATAELELVPAAAPRDVGIDRSMIGGYGHDDRVGAYAALRALLAVSAPRHTAIVLFVDKEEIGSVGNTGADSNAARRVIAELLEATGERGAELAIDRVLQASMVVSAGAIGAANPHYAKLFDARNSAFAGSGVVWNQSAAHAETMAYVRRLLDGANVTHQPATWGRTRGSRDEGGAVLPLFTRMGMAGVEMAIPVLSMHAPFEIVSKADLYEGYRAYRAFLND